MGKDSRETDASVQIRIKATRRQRQTVRFGWQYIAAYDDGQKLKGQNQKQFLAFPDASDAKRRRKR